VEAGDRSIEELELERDGMLIELLATTRANGEKAAQTAASGAGTTARTR
jgi:hypothetical protein